jgi:hypothetical protein
LGVLGDNEAPIDKRTQKIKDVDVRDDTIDLTSRHVAILLRHAFIRRVASSKASTAVPIAASAKQKHEKNDD